MNVETVARNIQIILAPVVMVTACAILLQGLLGRYSAFNDRLRLMVGERLKLLYTERPGDPFRTERLRQIDATIPLLLAHHRKAHDAVLAVYAAALIFVVDMFVIAFAAIYQWVWLADAALLLFLAGIAVLILGIMITALEVRTSHVALHYEVMRVAALQTEEKPHTGGTEEIGGEIEPDSGPTEIASVVPNPPPKSPSTA